MTDNDTKLEAAREGLIASLESQLKAEQDKTEALIEMLTNTERREALWRERFETLERETRKMREQVKSYYESIIEPDA